MIEKICNGILQKLRPYSESSTDTSLTSIFPDAYRARLSDSSHRVSLYYYDLLSQIPKNLQIFKDLPYGLEILDIGCLNFMYASGLVQWASELNRGPLAIEAIDADLQPMYWNLYLRRDVADYHASLSETLASKGSRIYVREADWLHDKVSEKREVDFITCFFPFLFEDLHSRFGRLKNKAVFDPERFYQKIFENSKRAIFFHQGEVEREESIRIIQQVCPSALIEYDAMKSPSPYLSWKQRTVVLAVYRP